MKIDNSGKMAAAYGTPVRTAKKDEESVKTEAKRSTGENVAINPFASRLQGVEKSAQASEAFDAEKVAAIKAAIASGEFKINAGAIADSLIASTRELLAE